MRAMLDYEPSETRKEFERGDIVRILDTEKFPPLARGVEVMDQGVVQGVSNLGHIQVLIPGRSLRGRTWLPQSVNPEALEHIDADL